MADKRPIACGRKRVEKKRPRQPVLRPTKSTTALDRAKLIENAFKEYGVILNDTWLLFLDVVLSVITSEKYKNIFQAAGPFPVNTPEVLHVRPQTPPRPETPSTSLEQELFSKFIVWVESRGHQNSQAPRATSPKDSSPKVAKRREYRKNLMQTTRTPSKKSRGEGSQPAQRTCGRCGQTGHYIPTCGNVAKYTSESSASSG
ncbi:hypothetical protein J3E71DRAFT_348027 [Bipolaris maydis]|nr:hypothetical protein J3E71DRAFT_348027 [Bipolaris maydis]